MVVIIRGGVRDLAILLLWLAGLERIELGAELTPTSDVMTILGCEVRGLRVLGVFGAELEWAGPR